MMVHHSKHVESQSTVVRKAFREYWEFTKSLLTLAETLSTKEWPDRKLVLQNAFKLQRLYIDREPLRFEYLLGGAEPDIVFWSSFSRIWDRLVKDWHENEEADLKKSNAIYGDLFRKIEDLQRALDTAALDEPFRWLSTNSIYCEARRVVAEKVQELKKKPLVG